MAKSSPHRPSRPAPLEGNRVWRERGRVRTSGPAVREANAWGRLPAWVQHAVCIGFLLVVALGFFAPTTIGGLSLAGGDTVKWRATAEAMLQAEAETGRLPLWSPNVFAGMPGFMIHYPPQVPGVDTLLTTLRGWGLWPVAHMMALLLGTYLLVVFLTRAKLAGVIAAVGFGLTTYLPIILEAGHNTKFIALAYAPWLLLGFAAVIRRPPGTRKALSTLLMLAFAIAAAVNLRAGHVQITYYVVFVAAFWWIAEGITAFREKQLPTFAASTGLLLLGSALAVAMVAHPYLPQSEYKAYTIRAAGPGGGLAWDYAMMWSQDWGELATLLVPNAYGGGGQTYWGAKPFTAGPHYVGPIILMLAAIGLLGVARRSVFAFGVAALVMVGFSLGENFALLNRPAFALLPLFDAFRVPETWLSVVALMLALLAGWGAYYLARREATFEAEHRKQRIAYGAMGGVAALTVLLFVLGGSVFSFERPDERETIRQAAAQQFQASPSDPQVVQVADNFLAEIRAERASLLRADAGRTLLFLALGAALVVLALRRKIPSYAALAGLALLVAIDLWGVGRRYFNEDSPALTRRADVAAAIPRTQADLWIVERVREAGGPGHFRVLPPSPTTNGLPSFFYESIGGYHGAKLALIQEYFDDLLPDDSTGYNRNALDLLAARYVVAPGVVPGTEPVFRDEQTGLVVAENPTALPRAFFVDAVEVIPDAEARKARLRDRSLNLRTTAVLETPAPQGFASGPTPDSGDVSVRLERFRPDEIVWEVETDRPRLLVVNEIYYPAGWHADLDGAEVPILRANHLLRAVPVPEGRHFVTMRFRPPLHDTSVLVSTLASLFVYGLALVLGGLLWYRRGHPA